MKSRMSLLQKGHFTAETQSTQRLYIELCALGVSAVSFCREVTNENKNLCQFVKFVAPSN
jgi:hypothetical protein